MKISKIVIKILIIFQDQFAEEKIYIHFDIVQYKKYLKLKENNMCNILNYFLSLRFV